jgi:hypothetical protein
LVGLIAVVLVGAGWAGRPARATIEPPPVTLPPLPAPVTSTLGLAGGPVLSAECGTLITVLTLVVPMLGGSLPINPIPLLAGVIDACGSVPQPNPTLKCGADQTISQELLKLLGSLKILAAIVNTQVAAPVAEEIQALGRAVPPALLVVDVGKLAAQVLQCAAQVDAKPGALPPGLISPSMSPPGSPPVSSSLPSPATPSGAPSGPVASPGPPAPAGSGPVASPTAPAGSQVAAPSLVVESVPSGATPVGSAVIGFVFMVIAGLGIAVKLRSRP